MVKVKFQKQNDFFQQVYQVVRLIPKGKVTSYGAIAKYLGSAKSSRMVGYAMNNAHTQIPPVPAHRVVNRNGVLTGKHFFANGKTGIFYEAGLGGPYLFNIGLFFY
jgi:methylated-DNA-protein-cysteine methyltransferase-like protein